MSRAAIRLAGLVVCGGRSRRMGQDKALITVGGRPLVVRVAELVGGAAEPVLLAPGRPGRLGDLGYQEVPDVIEDAGPLSGLVAGLAASPHPLLAVVGVDLPFASPALLRSMAEVHRGEDAVVPRTDRGLQPLHAVYARTALPALREALFDGRLALVEALSTLAVREFDRADWRPSDPSGRFALNVNRPEDLALIE